MPRTPDWPRIERARRFADRVREDAHPCVYGHLSCSDVDNGPCLDELFSALGLDNEGNLLGDRRMRTQPDCFTLLDGITTALNASLVRRAPTDMTPSPIAWQVVKLPASISASEGALFLQYHHDRKGDYINVSPDWPRDPKGQVYSERGCTSINVSAEKAPEQIARDIVRRFVPNFTQKYAAALERSRSQAAYDADVAGNYRLLAEACGGTVGQSWAGNPSVRGLPDGVDVKYVGADRIDLVLSCTPGQAAAILRERAKVHA